MINSMDNLTCQLLESRGADADNPRTRSLNAVRDSDLYIGLFGKSYSEITQDECKTALDNNKRCLIYVMDIKPEHRDNRVSEFIERELKHRISYHKFRSCKLLMDQIRRDLKAQMVLILRTGLDVMTQRKEEIKNREQEISTNIYSSSSPSDKNNVLSLLEIAKLDYSNGNYLDALTYISAYIELLLRRNLTEAKNEDYSKVPFHILLRESMTSNLLSPNVVTRLKVFWNVRNKAIHYGSVPSKADLKVLIELAKLMEQTFSLRLESSPILTERDRHIIASRFMQRLCELDSKAARLGQNREFTIDRIWDDFLSAYNKDIVAPFVIFYFDNELGYIKELPDKKINLTLKGSEHCKDEFILPAGL